MIIHTLRNFLPDVEFNEHGWYIACSLLFAEKPTSTRLSAMRSLEPHGIPLTIRDPKNNNHGLLHEAVRRKVLHAVLMCIHLGMDVNGYKELSILDIALNENNYDPAILRSILEAHPILKQKHLIIKCITNLLPVDSITTLSEFGANIFEIDSNGHDAMYYACESVYNDYISTMYKLGAPLPNISKPKSKLNMLWRDILNMWT